MPEPRLTIGSVLLESPFTLAALSGYSDVGMRVVCRALGASLTRHEVVLDKMVVNAGGGPRNGQQLDPTDRPIVAQLMGSDPVCMAAAARQMVSYGYDVIDLNFGCPVKKVLGRCRGGYLLSEPATAIEMVQRVRDAVDIPLTMKVRRGADDSTAALEQYWEILEGAAASGIAGVAVHGRTVEQRYEGRAQWEIIRQTKDRFPQLTVFGSGDLFTAEDCLNMLDQTGCDGVTIARGAIANPWIFRDCLALWGGEPKPPAPTVAEQAEILDRQYQLMLRQYGSERASRQMRKFGIKQAHLHPQADAVRAAFIQLATPSDWDTLRRQFYLRESARKAS